MPEATCLQGAATVVAVRRTRASPLIRSLRNGGCAWWHRRASFLGPWQSFFLHLQHSVRLPGCGFQVEIRSVEVPTKSPGSGRSRHADRGDHTCGLTGRGPDPSRWQVRASTFRSVLA